MQDQESYSKSQMNPLVYDLIRRLHSLYSFSPIFLCISYTIKTLLPIYIYIKQNRNQKMYITPAEYLNLTEKIHTLKNQCQELTQENKKLKDLSIQQQQTLTLYEKQKKEYLEKEREKRKNLADHVTFESNQIKNMMSITSQQQKNFLKSQILEFSEDSNAKKLDELENQMKDDRLLYNKYIQFYNRIKALYHSCTRKKQTPSLEILAQWVCSGRKHQVVANDFAEGILGGILGMNKTSNKNLRNSKTAIGKSTKSINGSTTGSKLMKNSKENNQQLGAYENNSEKEKSHPFVEALRALAQEKNKESNTL